MKEWILHYWTEALFGLIIAATATGYKRLSVKIKCKNAEQDAIKMGLQALLRDNLIRNYNHYAEKGFCPIYALENVNALYTQYHALGGNGTVTEIVERIKDLPAERREDD